jgi:hypothetical protein
MDVKQKANIVTCAWNYGFQFFLHAKDGVMIRDETHNQSFSLFFKKFIYLFIYKIILKCD